MGLPPASYEKTLIISTAYVMQGNVNEIRYHQYYVSTTASKLLYIF